MHLSSNQTKELLRVVFIWPSDFFINCLPVGNCYNGGHNTLRLYDILINFSFATSEVGRDDF